MTQNELGAVLRRMYETAPTGKTVVMIHLFGVKYANEVKQCGASAKEIATLAGIADSYGTEINKGVRLAEYVSVKPGVVF